MSVEFPTENEPERIDDDRVRYLIVRAAVRAASAMTAPDLTPAQRLETLMDCHGTVAAARGPAHRLPFADFRRVVTAASGEPAAAPAGGIAALLPPGVDPVDLEGLHAVDDDGRVTEDAFDLDLELRMLLVAVRGLDRRGGAVSDRQLQDEIEQETVYIQLSKPGDQNVYEAGRSDLINTPAGSVDDLAVLRLPPLVAQFYQDIPYASVHRGWWYPCPVCAWPMRIAVQRRGRALVGTARCWHAPHAALGAAYIFEPGGDGGAPQLIPELPPSRPLGREAVLAPTFGDVPAARPAAGHKALVRGVWRYTTVPGRPELDLRDALQARGIPVDLWPGLDAYDLAVHAGPDGKDRPLKVDVKDYTSAATLAKLIEAQRGDRGGADWLVVPDYRAGQVPLLSGVCARYDMTAATSSEFGEVACRLAGVSWT